MSLIDLQRQYILQIIDEVKTFNNLKFLVIDKQVQDIFDHIFPLDHNNTHNNILLKHVIHYDLIDDIKRQGEHPIECIYLLKPTKYNIKIMNSDFSQFPTKYKKCHIRFLPGLTSTLKKFLDNQDRLPYFIESFKECKLSNIILQNHCFKSLNTNEAFQIIYNKECLNVVESYINNIVQSLIGICVITNEYPIIRYFNPSEDQKEQYNYKNVSRLVAEKLQVDLDNYARLNDDFLNLNSSRQRSIMIICDRTLDLISPLIHDFSYQSLVYNEIQDKNVFNNETDVYRYEVENETGGFDEKDSIVRDIYDKIWSELKFMHIVDAKNMINKKIEKLISDNPLLVDRQNNVKTSSDLLSVVAHLKMFDEERRQLILHKTLIERCLSCVDSKKLAENIADTEQIMAGFGKDINGDNCSKNFTLEFLIEKVLCIDEININDKIRVITLYCIYRNGIVEDDLIKLLNFMNIDYQHPFFSHFVEFIRNFEILGLTLIKPTLKQSKLKIFKNKHPSPYLYNELDGRRKFYHDTITNNYEIYTTSRFIPACGVNISKSISNALLLPEDEFKFVKGIPVELYEMNEDLQEQDHSKDYSVEEVINSSNSRTNKIKTSWNLRKDSTPNIERQRIFYYVIGGLTHGEVKSAYDQGVWKNKDVFIGSDEIMTSSKFMENVLNVNRPRSVLNLKVDEKEEENIPDFFKYNNTKERIPNSQSRRPYEQKMYVEETSKPSEYMKQSEDETLTEITESKKKKSSRFKKMFK
ncbi:related to Protein transport protein SEC1 [Hanseniaspora guilliermondii]|uniref:Related to Protein transport protein SEC1 n=1 Tax=Hanseniaspora guilliermondii TaxID=56406 RepID=A0A1L0CPM3_9ASCO|nr:related to Protein transport protein SEC1 [Hanseniaspora guilliermondii]